MAIWLLAIALVTAGAARADTLEERIPVEAGGVLDVNLDHGDGLRPDPGWLEIASHDAAEVHVWAEAAGWGESDVHFQLEHSGHTVRLRGWVGGSFSWLFGGPNIQVRILVPRDFALDVRSTGGAVRIADAGGAVRVRTHTGDVEVHGAGGPVKIRVRSADTQVAEVAGDLDVRASDGAISARQVGGGIQARTGSGPIELIDVEGPIAAETGWGAIDLTRIRGPVAAQTERGSVAAEFRAAPAGHLETRRGSLDVVFPKAASLELDARSVRGEVRGFDDLALDGEASASRVRGRINGGGALLRLFTARGGVRLDPR